MTNQETQYQLLKARKELDNFMGWFKNNHPDLHEKYGRNIDLPFKPDGGVGVNNNFRISHEEHQMLIGIAKTYYEVKP